MYGQIKINVSAVTLGHGFPDEKKRKQNLPIVIIKGEFLTIPFLQSLQKILQISLSELYSNV